MASQETSPQDRAKSNGRQHPVSLPPRPRHTFSLRTVERLQQQQNLASAGTHVRPEQISTYVERMRNNLMRVESALRYRATHESGGSQTLLSKFERARVGQILADTVLDIVTISIASSNETYEAVVSPRTALSLSTPRVDATPPVACDAEDHKHSQLHSPAGEQDAESAPQTAGLIFPESFSVPSSPVAEGTRDAQGGQYPLSFNDSLLSLRFKPVLSMCSGAGSSTTGPPQRHRLRRPRKYYDIDLQRLSEFTRCLRLIQSMHFTDSDFEMLGLRYAIPGIRELDRSEEIFFSHPKRAEALALMGERRGSTGCEDYFTVKRAASVISTGGGTDAETQLDHDTDTYSAWYSTPVREKGHIYPLASTEEAWGADVCASPMAQPYKDHCLPLFRGGKETIVQCKDLYIFLGMVEMRLKQVDQELGGRLNDARADLPSSSGEGDTITSAT